MKKYVNVYNKNLEKIAVLQNAYKITETRELNKIYYLNFTLPTADTKLEFCQPLNYVRYSDDGDLYRIIKRTSKENSVGTVTFECEHVVATLCDTVMFGAFTYGGPSYRTRAVIEWLLSKQKTQHWVLGECDFDRKFEYGWEQENILNALYSIPKEFSETYQWTFDTTSHPWTINLKRIDSSIDPEFYIRAQKNLLSMDSTQDSTTICTRIYPLGYGEGVNQLNIKDVNDGVAYLQSPNSIVEQYGIIEKVLVDRRFEKAESLKSYAQTMLNELQTPSMQRTFDVADLYPITISEIDKAEVGKICKFTGDGSIAYITKTVRVHDQPGDLKIELSTKATDAASTIADLAERVRVESVYSQGATQLYQHSKDANATPSKGMILSLYFPTEMVQINKVLLKIQLNKFRSYSKTTDSGGGSRETSSSGGGSTQTSKASGSGSISVTSGASSKKSTDSGGAGSDLVTSSTSLEGNTNYATGDATTSHRHFFTLSGHSHTVSKSKFNHSHGIDHTHHVSASWGSHSHDVSIPAHSHDVTIPSHSHNIAAGIYESGNPTKFDLYVNDVKKKTIDSTAYEGNITEWLLDARRMIPRDTWIKIEIRPNDNSYVVSSVFVQGFIQSRGGGNY